MEVYHGIMRFPLLACLLATMGARLAVPGQVIEFEQNGLRYQTLTKNGLTIMFTHLPMQMKKYAALQIAVANGSEVSWTVRPEDFEFVRTDGSRVRPLAPKTVVDRMLQHGGRGEVIKLVSTYELGLYGMSRLTATGGYEERRRQALAEVSSTKLKAAAAASAVVYIPMKLVPGKSTDGAIFFELDGRPGLGEGTLTIRAAGEVFEFPSSGPTP
jgi:hypothetical protein